MLRLWLSGRLVDIAREVEEVDLLRQGRELEKLETEEAELKRQPKMQEEKAEALKRQFDELTEQRKQFRAVLQDMQEAEAQGVLFSPWSALVRFARSLGIERLGQHPSARWRRVHGIRGKLGQHPRNPSPMRRPNRRSRKLD
jgi:hypothetical protein